MDATPGNSGWTLTRQESPVAVVGVLAHVPNQTASTWITGGRYPTRQQPPQPAARHTVVSTKCGQKVPNTEKRETGSPGLTYVKHTHNCAAQR